MVNRKIRLSRKLPLYLCCCVITVVCISIILSYMVMDAATTAAAAERNRHVMYSTVNMILCFVCVFAVMATLFFRPILKNIQKINASLTKITDGDLNEVVNVRDSYEFDTLSTHINMTVERLKGYIHEAETRMDADLALARAIQKSALPSQFPAFPNNKEFDVFAGMLPAKEVGGDFYDFYFSFEDKFTIAIADVSGKGIPAAMFMMRGKSILKDVICNGIPLDRACMRVNDILCQRNDTNTFFTGWIGTIDLNTGVLTYVNAGHNQPLVRRNLQPLNKDSASIGCDEFTFLPCQPGLPMAIMEGFEYNTETIQLHPGDEVYLYTDGVTEATNTEDKLFGDNRLIDALNAIPLSKAGDPKYICQHLLNVVQRFTNGAEQSDDITMLCFKYIGSEKAL